MRLRFLGGHQWTFTADPNLTADYDFHAGNGYEQEMADDDAGFLLTHYGEQFAIVEPDAPAE